MRLKEVVALLTTFSHGWVIVEGAEPPDGNTRRDRGREVAMNRWQRGLGCHAMTDRFTSRKPRLNVKQAGASHRRKAGGETWGGPGTGPITSPIASSIIHETSPRSSRWFRRPAWGCVKVVNSPLQSKGVNFCVASRLQQLLAGRWLTLKHHCPFTPFSIVMIHRYRDLIIDDTSLQTAWLTVTQPWPRKLPKWTRPLASDYFFTPLHLKCFSIQTLQTKNFYYCIYHFPADWQCHPRSTSLSGGWGDNFSTRCRRNLNCWWSD